MTAARPLEQTLAELRRMALVARRRPARVGDAAPLIARVLGHSRTTAIEQRAGGLAFRLETEDESCTFTCVLHDASLIESLSTCELEVAMRLCDGGTLAQIARLRGVTVNTVKSQVRQIFRKLDVDTRVALVRRLCP